MTKRDILSEDLDESALNASWSIFRSKHNVLPPVDSLSDKQILLLQKHILSGALKPTELWLEVFNRRLRHIKPGL